jgi:mRNA-degrading endonuclease toxin of MazEF toxin-antitoxin module
MRPAYFQKGEIVNVDLGKPPTEIKGHEQGYERPCLIIKPFEKLGLAVIIPCTTKRQKYSYYTIVKLAKGSGGLKTDSYALCHQIRTIAYDRITSKYGKLGINDFLKIQSVLIDILELKS